MKKALFSFLILAIFPLFLLFVQPVQAQVEIGGQEGIFGNTGWAFLTKATCICSTSAVGGATVLGQMCNTSDITQQNMSITLGGNGPTNQCETSAMAVTYRYMDNMIDNPPVNTGAYVADLLDNVGMHNEAYAQGVGFAALSPVLSVWKASRNVAYFFFVIAFIVVGFAIMFRAKISAQTVVNIQMALPQLVITLLLITFSYAIAGFLIDIMYLFIYLMISVLSINVFKGNTTELTKVAFENNVIGNILGKIIGGNGFTSVLEAMSSMVQSVLTIDTTYLPGQVAEVVAGKGIGLIFTLIFSVIMLFNAFKIFFALLSAYIQIILLVITAPLRLLLNVYPGSNAFSSWLKAIAGHLAIFPVVVGMLFLAMAMLGIIESDVSFTDANQGSSIAANSNMGQVQAQGFAPPQLNFGGGSAALGIIAIGILLAIPQAVEQTKSAFGAGGGGGAGGNELGAAAGGAIGGIFGTMMSPVKGAGMLYQRTAAQTLLSGLGTGGPVGLVTSIPAAANPLTAVRRFQAKSRVQKAYDEQYEEMYQKKHGVSKSNNRYGTGSNPNPKTRAK